MLLKFIQFVASHTSLHIPDTEIRVTGGCREHILCVWRQLQARTDSPPLSYILFKTTTEAILVLSNLSFADHIPECMLICYLKQASNWANSYFLQHNESSPLLLCRMHITEWWETRVTIIDKYLSCLRNQAQLLERGTQHYLEFQTLDTQYCLVLFHLQVHFWPDLLCWRPFPAFLLTWKQFMLWTLWLQLNAETKNN